MSVFDVIVETGRTMGEREGLARKNVTRLKILDQKIYIYIYIYNNNGVVFSIGIDTTQR